MNDKIELSIDIRIPFIMSIVGQTHSGKSVLTRKLLKGELKNKFDYIFIMSPTIDLSKDWDADFKESPRGDDRISPCITHISDSNEFTPRLKEIFDKQEGIIKTYKKHEVPEVLIILDDVASEKVFHHNGFLDKKSISSRHYHISLLLISQKISSIGRCLRLQTSYFIVFSSFNYTESERFISEYVPKKYQAVLMRELENIFNEPWNFVVCNNNEVKIFDRLWLNGKEKIDLKQLLLESRSTKNN